MTELIYYTDAYLRNCEAKVITVDERGIALDRTVFYSLGGGQPDCYKQSKIVSR
jgi:misacylated tRNA(Ala) deacylase